MLPLNKNHRDRLKSLLIGFILLSVGLFLFGQAYQSSINIYKSPTELLNTNLNESLIIRLGGFVSKDSIKRDELGILHFMIEDNLNKIPVVFNGIPPNLFKEEQAAIAIGFFKNGIFHAHEILAKHDENYVIPSKVVLNVS